VFKVVIFVSTLLNLLVMVTVFVNPIVLTLILGDVLDPLTYLNNLVVNQAVVALVVVVVSTVNVVVILLGVVVVEIASVAVVIKL
jgi:hypothetical protein